MTLAGALLFALSLQGAQSPEQTSPTPDRVPGSELTVSLLTMGPGLEAVWEQFGHDALWIRNEETGEDFVWHWGVFDFRADDYYPRLIRGDMRYWMQRVDLNAFISRYTAFGRSITRQELALTPTQRLELFELVRENDTDENRFYIYDYYLDNCSTRIRDALDTVLDGQIAETLQAIPTGTTYRSHTRRVLQNSPVLYTGIQVVLNADADQELSAWEEAFLPARLAEHLNAVTVVDEAGVERSLIARETLLARATIGPEPEPASSRFWLYFGLGVLVAFGMLTLARLARRGQAWGRIGFSLMGGGWALFAGLGGFAPRLRLGLHEPHLLARQREPSPVHSAASSPPPSHCFDPFPRSRGPWEWALQVGDTRSASARKLGCHRSDPSRT